MRGSVHHRPGAIGLSAGVAIRDMPLAADIGCLAVVRAAEAIRIVVIPADAERAAMVVAGIAPVVVAVDAAGIEAGVIGLVGVAAIFAIEIARKRRPHRAADHHACDRGAGAPPAGGMTQQPANQRADKHAGRIGRIAALAIIDVVVIGVGTLVATVPALIAVAPVYRRGDDPGRNCREEKIVVVVADPAIAARRAGQAVLLPIVDVIAVLPVLIRQTVAARPAACIAALGEVIAAILDIARVVADLVLAVLLLAVLIPAVLILAVLAVVVLTITIVVLVAAKRRFGCAMTALPVSSDSASAVIRIVFIGFLLGGIGANSPGPA